MAELENKDKAKRELRERIERACNELTVWELLSIYIYIQMLTLREKLNEMAWKWLLLQLDVDKQIRSFIK